MHPAITEILAREHIRELERDAAASRPRLRGDRGPDREGLEAAVTIRFAGPDDLTAIEQLAALEGRGSGSSPWLVAEQAGRVTAALSTSNRVLVADPFRPTAHLESLLTMRAKQLCRRRERRLFRPAVSS